MSPCRLFVFIVFCAAASACGSGSATSPTAPGATFTGEWSGTTVHGVPIAFTVSAEQTVTSITVGYRFNGCSASKTFSNLSLEIGLPPFPPGRSTPSANPGFGYGSGNPEAADFTQVTGAFTSSQTAAGTAVFLNVANCGNSAANWSATRR
jgi:hypothetical protein